MATKRPTIWRGGLEKLLLNHYVTLKDKLQADEVIPHLIQEGILSIEDKQEIMAHATSQQKAQALVDKLITHGNCTPSPFVDILRRSGHEHLAEVLEGEPNIKVARTEGIGDMTVKQLFELQSRLQKVYRAQVERYEGNTSLEGLMGYEMGDAEPIRFFLYMNTAKLVINTELLRVLRDRCRSFVVKEETGRQVGTAFALDWLGDQKVTSDFKQMYKLKLNKVRKNQKIIDIIFDQLLHDAKYEASFSKESLWRHMEQTQEEILFVLEGLDRLNPFTSMEILQLIDKKLLPRATIIVTVAEANGG